MDTGGLKFIQIHPMDWGSIYGTISCEDHTMTVSPFWHDCGQTGEILECSCGFASEKRYGGGCHMHPYANRDHVLDEQHRVMYTATQVWHRAQPRIEDAVPEPNLTNEELIEKLCDAVAEKMQLQLVDWAYAEDVARLKLLCDEIIPELRAQVLERMYETRPAGER
jgi:hypothetical protein